MHDEAAVFADARLTLAVDGWRSTPRRVRRLPLRRGHLASPGSDSRLTIAFASVGAGARGDTPTLVIAAGRPPTR